MRVIEMKVKDVTITKSALARSLKCAPSSISNLCNHGLPVRADGRLDRRAALIWIVNQTSGAGGGWNNETRGKADLRERAQALLSRKGTGRVQPVTKRVPSVRALSTPAGVSGDDWRRVAVDILRRIASPLEVLGFARVCLRAGCTPEQAYVLAGWFAVQPTLDLSEITSDDLVDIDFPEPTEEQWKNLLGGDFDFDAGDALENEVDPARIDAASAAKEQS
jgi:hypothetical protein